MHAVFLVFDQNNRSNWVQRASFNWFKSFVMHLKMAEILSSLYSSAIHDLLQYLFKPWPVWVADNKQQMYQSSLIPHKGPPLETSNIIFRLGSESIHWYICCLQYRTYTIQTKYWWVFMRDESLPGRLYGDIATPITTFVFWLALWHTIKF